MATGSIETHLHRFFNWENAAPGALEGPRGRTADCVNGLSAQCVRLRLEIKPRQCFPGINCRDCACFRAICCALHVALHVYLLFSSSITNNWMFPKSPLLKTAMRRSPYSLASDSKRAWSLPPHGVRQTVAPSLTSS